MVLLATIPIILGYFIDSSLCDPRYFIINLIWLTVFTITGIYFKSIKPYKLAVILFFIIGLLEILHWLILNGPVTITSLMVISDTNLNEAQEFMSLKTSSTLLILIPYILIFILAFSKRVVVNSVLNKWILGLVSAFSIIFITDNIYHDRFIRKSSPQIVKVAYSFIKKHNLIKEAMKTGKPRNVKAKIMVKNKQQTFVLILGESCSRRHMSLYGYNKNTTPKLKKRTDLVVYNDVISPYSSTINSVLSICSQSNLVNNLSFDKSVDIMDIFHSAGFKTYWLSNQSFVGIWDNVITLFGKKSDKHTFVNTTSNSSYESTLNRSYDAKLFKPFITSLNDTFPKKLIVLHLIGNHTAYNKRYPEIFQIYKGTDLKTNTIAHYDNSIVYMDYVVDSILNILKFNKNTTFSSAIYLSDHGENVYDEGERTGHDFTNNIPKVNVEIPFFVWVSSAFKQQNDSLYNQIINNKNQPYISDNLFHSLMDINNITSLYLEMDKSIFNPLFIPNKKRVLADSLDYDLK